MKRKLRRVKKTSPPANLEQLLEQKHCQIFPNGGISSLLDLIARNPSVIVPDQHPGRWIEYRVKDVNNSTDYYSGM